MLVSGVMCQHSSSWQIHAGTTGIPYVMPPHSVPFCFKGMSATIAQTKITVSIFAVEVNPNHWARLTIIITFFSCRNLTASYGGGNGDMDKGRLRETSTCDAVVSVSPSVVAVVSEAFRNVANF